MVRNKKILFYRTSHHGTESNGSENFWSFGITKKHMNPNLKPPHKKKKKKNPKSISSHESNSHKEEKFPSLPQTPTKTLRRSHQSVGRKKSREIKPQGERKHLKSELPKGLLDFLLRRPGLNSKRPVLLRQPPGRGGTPHVAAAPPPPRHPAPPSIDPHRRCRHRPHRSRHPHRHCHPPNRFGFPTITTNWIAPANGPASDAKRRKRRSDDKASFAVIIYKAEWGVRGTCVERLFVLILPFISLILHQVLSHPIGRPTLSR